MTAETAPLLQQLTPHLKELRHRLVVSVLSVVLFSSVAYYYSEQLATFFMAPLFAAQPALHRLIYTTLTEAFFSYIKLAILVGVIVSFPVLCFQTWMFVAPGLEDGERKYVRLIVFWSSMLFGAGMLFCYFVVLPRGLSFLLGLPGERVRALPKVGAYLTFVARTCLAFGLAFEIPFLMVAVGKVGLVGREYFVRQRKYFAIAILVLSFLLTAGDPFGAVLLALPLFGLYEVGILVMRLFGSGKPADVG